MIKLKSIKGKSKKRPGRGISAGGGKTAGRGTKGQKSRAGHNIPNRFEGGQTVLAMRLPKLPGFKSKGKKAIVITLDDISRNFKDGETVSKERLIEKKMIGKLDEAKVLNTGKLTVKVTLGDDVKCSKSIVDLFTISKSIEEKSVASSRTEPVPSGAEGTRDPEINSDQPKAKPAKSTTPPKGTPRVKKTPKKVESIKVDEIPTVEGGKKFTKKTKE